MPQLTLRDVDFGLVRLLKQRAAKNGRAPEVEHRAILEQVLRGDGQKSGAKLETMFAALGWSSAGDAAPPSPPARDPEGTAS